MISSSAPLFFLLIGLVIWVTVRATQAFNNKELTIQKGLRELAEKQEGIAKATVQELEKKLSDVTPKSDKPVPPPDLVAIVMARPAIRQAFDELTSTQGFHLPVDPREKNVQVGPYLLNQQEIERMAAGRYFVDRGLVGVVRPDQTGTGVTVIGSSAAVAAYVEISKIPKPPSGTEGST